MTFIRKDFPALIKACLTGGVVTLLCVLLNPNPLHASLFDLDDASIFHYELYEIISQDNTRVIYNTDTPDPIYNSNGGIIDYKELQTNIFSEILAPVTGGDQPTTNNNAIFWVKDLSSMFTYTHFFINPALSSASKSLITPITEESLIEFSLKIDIADYARKELMTVNALPIDPLTGSPITLVSGVKAKSLDNKEIEFSLYDDWGNPVVIAELQALGGLIASTENGSIQINITGYGTANNAFTIKKSTLELEYVSVPVPEPGTFLLLSAGLLSLGVLRVMKLI